MRKGLSWCFNSRCALQMSSIDLSRYLRRGTCHSQEEEYLERLSGIFSAYPHFGVPSEPSQVGSWNAFQVYPQRMTRCLLQWRHNERDGVSNHQPHDCLLNRLLRRRSKKTSKLRVTGLCTGNSSVAGEIPTQRASNAENVSIWWRHHVLKEFKSVLKYGILPCHDGNSQLQNCRVDA